MAKVNPIPPALSERDVLRFWGGVDKSPGQGPTGNCWTWRKCIQYGYGVFGVGGRNCRASRVALLIATGEWPLLVCHHCDYRACCRPEHLFGGSHKDNTQDAVRKGRLSSGADHWSRRSPDLVVRGSRSGMARLTEASVVEIRQLRGSGLSTRVLAQKYEVALSTIKRALSGQTWKHV